MEAIDYKKLKLKFHNIVFAVTSNIDYDMNRWILLENVEGLKYDEYIILEGGHCSCYDFDDTEWEGMKYTKEELIKIAKDRIERNGWYREEKQFYQHIIDYFKEVSK